LVRVAGAVADKPSRLVAPGDSVSVAGSAGRFVSRGGEKLDGALTQFSIDVAGLEALDAGASTGGFTDCLLQRGAAAVLAVDVGRGQLHERLGRDGRVTSRERTDIRSLVIDRSFDLIVADLSFISLRTIAPVLAGTLAAEGADLVILVKPQFEAGKQAVSRGRGVIRDPLLWRQALEQVASAFEAAGAAIMGAMVSPLTGADGNVEFFLHGVAHSDEPRAADLDQVVASVQPDA
jgi:23S rRNA (cytidine1920-2'-O)/16S rRNA (cytidine1409-2'-O)-methyltransferase